MDVIVNSCNFTTVGKKKKNAYGLNKLSRDKSRNGDDLLAFPG